jgi:hypothetical protein
VRRRGRVPIFGGTDRRVHDRSHITRRRPSCDAPTAPRRGRTEGLSAARRSAGQRGCHHHPCGRTASDQSAIPIDAMFMCATRMTHSGRGQCRDPRLRECGHAASERSLWPGSLCRRLCLRTRSPCAAQRPDIATGLGQRSTAAAEPMATGEAKPLGHCAWSRYPEPNNTSNKAAFHWPDTDESTRAPRGDGRRAGAVARTACPSPILDRRRLA